MGLGVGKGEESLMETHSKLLEYFLLELEFTRNSSIQKIRVYIHPYIVYRSLVRVLTGRVPNFFSWMIGGQL